LALCAVLFFVSAHYSKATLERTREWSNAITGAALDLSEAHLWLEEFLSGDSTVDVRTQVRGPMNEVRSACGALLDGARRPDRVARLTDPHVRAAFTAGCETVPVLQALTTRRLADARPRRPGTDADRIFDARYNAAASSFQRAIDGVRALSRSRARELTWLNRGIAVLVVGVLLAIGAVIRLSQRNRDALIEQEAARSAYRRTQSEFVEELQSAHNEEEADGVLKGHLERNLPGVHVTVLRRSNSADRLEPTTPIADESALNAALAGAQPAQCLAVRRGRSHTRGDSPEPLMACPVCGTLGDRTTCTPLLVAGEVIGSVLVEHQDALSQAGRERLEESVRQASPILANLRNLRVAERIAATDQLTGLGNARAAHETLRRLVAHSARTQSPLSLILLDLDHFKLINDRFGHPAGDDVLASVGQVLATSLRASDFAARFGGEEFLIALPDTSAETAFSVAEKLRVEIGKLRVTGVGDSVSASLGVASFPDEAPDPQSLIYVADRALYRAKDEGRNRVARMGSGEDAEVSA
jgi:diguanylate cyclase (GGDEF)-like protein